MGKKDTPAAPAPPDPYKTAAAQTQGDIQSAIANATLGNIDTYTPLGSQTYQQIGTQAITDAQGHVIQVPRYSSTQTLSPQQQAALQSASATRQRVEQPRHPADRQTDGLARVSDRHVQPACAPDLS
jgi:hypothetical protein